MGYCDPAQHVLSSDAKDASSCMLAVDGQNGVIWSNNCIMKTEPHLHGECQQRSKDGRHNNTAHAVENVGVLHQSSAEVSPSLCSLSASSEGARSVFLRGSARNRQLPSTTACQCH